MIRATRTFYCRCNAHKIILPTFDNWREWLILLQSTRMVDSGIFIAKIGWFYPNRESTFWAMHAILAMRNNKMGHRINKMWTLINKVGHRNVKLVDTYQQVGFKKQQNGSRVLYPDVTLADQDTNSILTDNANRAIEGNVAMQVLLVANFGSNASGVSWWPNFEPMQVVPSVGQIFN